MEIPKKLKREVERGRPLVQREGKLYVVIHDKGKYRMLVADENALVTSIEKKGTVWLKG